MADKKPVVVFGSKYGNSKKYAQWLAEDLNCDVFDCKSVAPEKLADYDVVVFIGGLYAGKLRGVKLIANNFDSISTKDLVLITCGMSSPTDPESVANIMKGLKETLPAPVFEKAKVFHVRGGINYPELGFIDKMLMKVLIKVIAGKKDKTPDDEAMLETYGKNVDQCDRSTIAPIVEYVRAL